MVLPALEVQWYHFITNVQMYKGLGNYVQIVEANLLRSVDIQKDLWPYTRQKSDHKQEVLLYLHKIESGEFVELKKTDIWK